MKRNAETGTPIANEIEGDIHMKNENDFLREVLEMPYYSLVPKILMNALRLGVFDELKMPQESGQLAEKKGWNRENTEIFLQTLFSLEYLTKDGNPARTPHSSARIRRASRAHDCRQNRL